MQLDEALKNVSVLGAAGKMGSGISLLLLQEIARCEAQLTGSVGSGNYCLNLIDSNEQGLYALRKYLFVQMTKYAEKNIVLLRSYYANNPQLISNEEIIRAFLEGAQQIVRFDSELWHARDSTLIFEAIVEDIFAKEKTLSSINSMKRKDAYYFSNTSSIPIKELNRKASLNNRIIGFHFYNPPAVQKLVELIIPEQIDPLLTPLAVELGKRLQKKVVFAKDIAGFIGNGHFIREIKFACNAVNKMLKTYPDITQAQAIYLINRITQIYLLRPMGIFQLIDYVGIDVCQKIAGIMDAFLPGNELQEEIIETMMRSGIRGGQNSDGTQKNGFFQYERQSIKGVYSLKEKKYRAYTEGNWKTACDKLLEPYPETQISWKSLQQDDSKENKIKQHFDELLSTNTVGARLAKSFLLNSREISLNLVADGIAEKVEDVDTVLQNGFFHLYGTNPLWLERMLQL